MQVLLPPGSQHKEEFLWTGLLSLTSSLCSIAAWAGSDALGLDGQLWYTVWSLLSIASACICRAHNSARLPPDASSRVLSKQAWWLQVGGVYRASAVSSTQCTLTVADQVLCAQLSMKRLRLSLQEIASIQCAQRDAAASSTGKRRRARSMAAASRRASVATSQHASQSASGAHAAGPSSTAAAGTPQRVQPAASNAQARHAWSSVAAAIYAGLEAQTWLLEAGKGMLNSTNSTSFCQHRQIIHVQTSQSDAQPSDPSHQLVAHQMFHPVSPPYHEYGVTEQCKYRSHCRAALATLRRPRP